MCGIFGFVTRSDEVASRLDPEAARRALAHRGPDDWGAYEGHVGEARCTLVHTRLAIIDLSPAGHQPMPSGDGRYQVVFNGELYNHAEVRAELEALGARFRSSSDTEVLVEAYARWGAAALDRFRGMFAFAIWDTRLGTLFLARDRLGIKPLYVADLPCGGLAFASELRALLAAGAAPRRLSREGLRSYLTWGSVAEPLTMIEGVRTHLPATHATWREGALREATYWRLRPGPTVEVSFDEAVERVRPALREAVKLRLVSDVPVGVFLSGGIDSSVLATLACRASREKVQAFTVAYDDAMLTEAEQAGELAREVGCEHHVLTLRPTELLEGVEHALGALDQPSADGVNTYFVSKAVRGADIKVALSGLGGDELFAGYGYFRQFARSRRLAGRGPHGLEGVFEAAPVRRALGSRSARAAKLGALLGGPPGPGGAYAALRCMFTPTQVDQLLGGGEPAGADRWRERGAEVDASHDADPVSQLSALELAGYLRNTLLRDADVMSMAHALEVRVPLLDHRLVETVVPLTGAVKLRPGLSKPLLSAVVPELPEAVRVRSKRGFVLPFEAWLKGPLSGRLTDLLESPSPLDRVVDRAARADLGASFRAGRTSASRVWCLAAALEWSRRLGMEA